MPKVIATTVFSAWCSSACFGVSLNLAEKAKSSDTTITAASVPRRASR